MRQMIERFYIGLLQGKKTYVYYCYYYVLCTNTFSAFPDVTTVKLQGLPIAHTTTNSIECFGTAL